MLSIASELAIYQQLSVPQRLDEVHGLAREPFSWCLIALVYSHAPMDEPVSAIHDHAVGGGYIVWCFGFSTDADTI